jgi:hypothetical protein
LWGLCWVMKLGSSARAIAILAGAAAVAFGVSTAAVSSASTTVSPASPTVLYHFASFSFSGSVATPQPARPSTFSLSFLTTFKLASNSPGIVNKSTGTLDNVVIAEQVSYPVPGGRFVGPVRLPFSSEKLRLVVAIKGTCFVPNPVGGYMFKGGVKCAAATLTLGPKSYNVSALLRSIIGTFKPPLPGGLPAWSGSLTAGFVNPGYTFPVATLGSGGFTSLLIGLNGASVPTRSISFAS